MAKYTVERLLRTAWRPDIERTKNVSVVGYRGMVSGGRTVVRTITRDREAGETRKHTQEISPADPKYRGKLVACDAIHASCDCQRWLFVFEYAAAQRGAARIIHGNGAPPTETNPRNRIGICKHLILALLAIIKHKL